MYSIDIFVEKMSLYSQNSERETHKRHPMHPPLSSINPPNHHLIPTLLLHRRRPQHTHTITPPPPLPHNLTRPIKHLPRPTPRNHNTTDNIHQPNNQSPEATPLLHHRQQNRLNIELDEDTRYVGFGDLVGLRSNGVLVGFDGVGGVEHV